MLQEMFDELNNLPAQETASLLVTAGKSLINTHKSASDWKKIFVNTGKFFIENEQNADVFFDDLANILSEENMTHIANESKNVNGYYLKDKYKAKHYKEKIAKFSKDTGIALNKNGFLDVMVMGNPTEYPSKTVLN